MTPPPRALPDELLLRLPPDDPGSLFRASLVCKPWHSRLTGSAFPRLYREYHGTPPLLGFFENDETVCCWFAPLSPTSPFLPVHPGHHDLFALDSRHGLVLLTDASWNEPLTDLVVWDPVRHRRWKFPIQDYWESVSAAVLCAVDGCDHLDCRGGPFLVVYVGTDESGFERACAYSSEARAWSPVASCEHPAFSLEVISSSPKALVGNSLYFLCTSGTIILRYNLFTQELSVITWPATYKWEHDNHILLRMEGGVLGCATLQESKLELWAMDTTDGAVKWVLRRVIEIENWLPCRSNHVINFADGLGIFFVRTDSGIFTGGLKSGRIKKISRRTDQVIPYIRFYTPDQSGSIRPISTMASSENVDTVRDEHHDLLLPHSSGKVGDDNEKWVENGESDSEWEEEEGSDEDYEWEKKKPAQDMYEAGSEAIEGGEFGLAQNCFSDALFRMVLYYGRLSTMCIGTYYKYGLALLYEAQTNNALYQELVNSTTNRVDTGSSRASGSNIREGDTGKDLDLAWKMLSIARVILEKSPCISPEKVETFCALAEVSMEREDIDYSLHAWFKALAMLEHLVEPDHCRIVLLNLQIFLAFNSASKIGDALPYATKVFSLLTSRMQKLGNANGALLADKGDNASAAEVGSEKSSLDKETELLAIIFIVAYKELKDVTQSMLTLISEASVAQNVGYVTPGAASLTSEIAGPSNSISTAATIETPNLGAAGHVWSKLKSSRFLPRILLARNLQRILQL